MSQKGSTRLSHVPDEVVEIIRERLPVKSLVRLKTVSKKWRFSIESQAFQERHLTCRRKESGGADVLFVALIDGDDDDVELDLVKAQRSRTEIGSSVIRTVRLPDSSSMTEVCHGSCEGILCLYGMSYNTRSLVVNPATRWYRSFPCSRVQQLFIDRRFNGDDSPCPKLGFGKDKETGGTFKLVWLYNSSDSSLDKDEDKDNVTTCEVFDFSTDAWRYLLPASPYQVLYDHKPVYLDGSLYWLTMCEDTKVLSFDLHTETFQVIANPPFSHKPDPRCITLCVLDNRLCVSQKIWPNQRIWFLDPSDQTTWRRLCSIRLRRTRSWFDKPNSALLPVALLKPNKLLIHSDMYLDPLVLYDPSDHSAHPVYSPSTAGEFHSYSPSLLACRLE